MIRASPLEPEVYGACAGGNGNGTGNGNGNELYTTVAYRTSSYGNKELLKSGTGRSSKHLRGWPMAVVALWLCGVVA